MRSLVKLHIWLLVFSNILAVYAAGQDYYKTTVDARLRKGPGTKYKSFATVKKGEQVSVLDKNNLSWFKIDYNGTTGYVSSKLLVETIVQKSSIETEATNEKDASSDLTALYIVGAIVILIVIIIASSKTKKTSQPESKIQSVKPPVSIPIRETLSPRANPVIIKAAPVQIEQKKQDETIIDVKGSGYTLPGQAGGLIKYPGGVPFWSHRYVYSYEEIKYANVEQTEFYKLFKSHFLKKQFIDLEGNSNYAFILLFDLLNNDYVKHNDLELIRSQFQDLGTHYPKTKAYAIPFLLNKLKDKGAKQDYSSINRESIADLAFGESYWGLGNKYKSDLHLNEVQVRLLNKLVRPDNNFCNIEFCFVETLKLFLYVLGDLGSEVKKNDNSLEQFMIDIATNILKKQFGYKDEHYNYKYSIGPTIAEVFGQIFKQCENSVRDIYGHKRKISTDLPYTNEFVRNELTQLFSLVHKIINQHIIKVQLPNEPTEIELNNQNTTRWKEQFERIKREYSNNPREFLQKINDLAKLNKKNPSVENIFFEASKHLATIDKEIALKLYFYYLFYDLKSTTFDNRQLTKTIQKSLFDSNEQLRQFETLVAELIRTKNLSKALEKVPDLYRIKRKKIALNQDLIQEVKQEHKGTVELLNEYLKEEIEIQGNLIKAQEINETEVEVQIISKNEGAVELKSGLLLQPIHLETLEVFFKHNYQLSQAELEIFAKSKNVLINQLIERVNDICYETLDDLLIEEDENYYVINQEYYKKIFSND